MCASSPAWRLQPIPLSADTLTLWRAITVQVVVRRGRAITARPPDYSVLDYEAGSRAYLHPLPSMSPSAELGAQDAAAISLSAVCGHHPSHLEAIAGSCKVASAEQGSSCCEDSCCCEQVRDGHSCARCVNQGTRAMPLDKAPHRLL